MSGVRPKHCQLAVGEKYFGVLCRGCGIVGSFHKVSKKYLPLYVAKFQFRDNNRFNADIFGTAISGC